MTAFDLPLFGEPDPVQRPGKTALGYLSWLNDVDVDGWRFWALAGSNLNPVVGVAIFIGLVAAVVTWAILW